MAAVAAWWFGSHGLTAEGQIRKRSEKLRLVFVDRDPKMARWLISDRYLDQWGMIRIDNIDYELPPDYTPGMFSENRGSLEESLSREAGAR